jgi:hypothetical protein
LTTKFLKFFPTQKTKQLRREILTFKQKDRDLFFEAWEHFNELLLKCPRHNISQEDQVLAFYEGLNDVNNGLVGFACGGMLMEKTCEEAVELFETRTPNNSHPEGDKDSKERAYMKRTQMVEFRLKWLPWRES